MGAERRGDDDGGGGPVGGDAPLVLLGMSDGLIHAQALHFAAELGIGDLLADGPLPSADLAAATSCDPGALYRMLRMLAACGVFTETGPGTFALTPLGHPLRSDHPRSVRSVLIMNGTLLPLVLDGCRHTLRTGEPAFTAVTGEDIFDHLARDPGHADVFDAAMAELTRVVLPAVLDAYDFSSVRRVVDVGGGTGALLGAVLRAAPGATGVVLDTPHVADAARERMRAEGLADRATATGGDFFREVPPGGDLYLLERVLHDWPDDQATRILRNCRHAMGDGARLLLIESVLPPGDTYHPAKTMDLSMLVISGGRERTVDEFTGLLAAAGLRLVGVIPTASPYSLIEAVPAPVPAPDLAARPRPARSG
ncbi:methyltransferase [Nocardiopsis sediminis]|uniref:Methyltransferase n=1 Tax=Nocardiopsis sediminis TaxID=1778267 RepID=A0ABV8FK81_9ACTN